MQCELAYKRQGENKTENQQPIASTISMDKICNNNKRTQLKLCSEYLNNAEKAEYEIKKKNKKS